MIRAIVRRSTSRTFQRSFIIILIAGGHHHFRGMAPARFTLKLGYRLELHHSFRFRSRPLRLLIGLTSTKFPWAAIRGSEMLIKTDYSSCPVSTLTARRVGILAFV